jgi:deazaflavin-dependent oxidoreductase (nitroreductase family)
MSDWNANIIREFRESGGSVEAFKGATMVLLHTRGAKSGQERINPLVTQTDGDGRWLIFASAAGSPKHPDWYHNVKAGGPVLIEVGTETVAVTARILEGEERDRSWSKQKELMPGFADYETKTEGIREIPVILLERATPG